MQRIVFVLLAGALLGGCGGKEASNEKKIEAAWAKSNEYWNAVQKSFDEKLDKAVRVNPDELKVFPDRTWFYRHDKTTNHDYYLLGPDEVGSSRTQQSYDDQEVFWKKRGHLFRYRQEMRTYDISGLEKDRNFNGSEGMELLLKQAHLIESPLAGAGFIRLMSVVNCAPYDFDAMISGNPEWESWAPARLFSFHYFTKTFLSQKDPGNEKLWTDSSGNYRNYSLGENTRVLRNNRTYVSPDSAATLTVLLTLYLDSRCLRVEFIYTDRTVLSADYPVVEGWLSEEVHKAAGNFKVRKK